MSRTRYRPSILTFLTPTLSRARPVVELGPFRSIWKGRNGYPPLTYILGVCRCALRAYVCRRMCNVYVYIDIYR
uniref:Putative secreted peptide n=1 Tax=Anopheles braziliensis TaxID=58242 RepID=A0A2M3ZX16_9DIPT